MIKVFNSTATAFTTNGIGQVHNITRAITKIVLNGMYSLEMDVTFDKESRWKDLAKGNIVHADSQPFRIYDTEVHMTYVTVYARHVFWDLYDNEVLDTRPTDKNCLGAMQDVITGLTDPTPFTVFSDIVSTATQYFIKRNGIDCLIGKDSILTRWGGELDLQGWQIRIMQARGSDKGVQIAYRKNMTELIVKESLDGLITKIRPVGENGLQIPEVYVNSPLIESYWKSFIREIPFPEIKEADFETLADAEQALRQKAIDYFAIMACDVPLVNIKADMILLENTAEYAGFENLVRVGLGDTVTCKHQDLGITHKLKVISLEKDLLTGKNVKVELGDTGRTMPSVFNKTINAIKDISTIVKTASDLATATAEATALLSSALGGYVVKKENEILIMSDPDIQNAQFIWKWNLNGLGYSKDYGANYGLAMTMDGKINADFITTGMLNAGMVKTGILQSADGKVWINLDDASFNFGDRFISDGTSFQFNFAGTTLEANLNAKADTTALDAVDAKATATANTVNANQTELTKYIRFIDGDIVLGELNNPITLKIENDKIAFYQNNVLVAEFTDNKLVTTDIKVTTSIRIGNFAFTPRTNGNLSFSKVTI